MPFASMARALADAAGRAPGSIPASPSPLPRDRRLGRKGIVTQKIIDSGRHTALI
jgi:hypothetical protein